MDGKDEVKKFLIFEVSLIKQHFKMPIFKTNKKSNFASDFEN